ncbi:MAG TPA: deoxyribonuclease V [Chthonomonadaceae bacterium]|nr:deoxyribonuclease V [Chthonomonadaceae bacterium]
MEYRTLHDWNVTQDQAKRIQRELAGQVRQEPLDVDSVRLAAGSDISFESALEQTSVPVYAGFVILQLPELTPVERAGVATISRFPYIPGLLSFREVPPLLEAWSRLTRRPEALIADGQGLAHPRRFGLACHLGLVLDLPTVGVAKSLLVGRHDSVPDEIGAWAPLVDKGEIIGAALRMRLGAAPVYVSVGHRIDLPSAIALVLRCRGKTRVPETTRQAHLFVNALRRGEEMQEMLEL